MMRINFGSFLSKQVKFFLVIRVSIINIEFGCLINSSKLRYLASRGFQSLRSPLCYIHRISISVFKKTRTKPFVINILFDLCICSALLTIIFTKNKGVSIHNFKRKSDQGDEVP